MCTHASSRVKRKSFYRNSEFQMVLCWFPAAIFVYHNCTQVWRLHTKLCKGAWNVSANNSETVGHKDLRLGQIVYILVFYNISFSWLLPLDAFQFIFFSAVFIAWRSNRSIELYPLALSRQMCSKNYWLRSIYQRRYFKTSSPLYSKLWN